MTDKKEMSVNESLAKVNKILRSAGDLILPRETNIALSILADVACQQQEEIDALRERVQSQLPSDTSDAPERRIDKNLLIVLDALGRTPVLDVLGREPICNNTIKYARNLFLHIESKVKDLIKENETLRNAEKCKSQNLPMTIEHSVELNGTTTISSPAIEVISHLIKDGSIPLGEKHKEDRQDMIRSIHESLNIDSISQGYENQECKEEGVYSFGEIYPATSEDIVNDGEHNFFKSKYYINGAHVGSIVFCCNQFSESIIKKEIKSNSFSTGQRIEVVNAVYEAIRRVGLKHGVSNCTGDEMRQILNAYFDISRKEI
ncbi:hypothetical protein VU677_00485 [Hafnia paralvei]|uniref:hypothetical protein n=1 Tax=Hafnia paralvei TaxID=546367 RepID=UPI00300DAEE9